MVQSWWFGLNPNLQHFKINIHYIMNIHYILYNTLSLKPSIFTPLISSKTVLIQPITHNILPSFAQVLAIKNTYAPLLPWQTKSILIIFQVPPKMLSFALICPDLPSISERLFCLRFCHKNTKRCKIRQIDAVNRSKNVVGIGGGYYCEINSCFSALLDKSKFKL